MTRLALAGPSDLVTNAGAVAAANGGSIVDIAIVAALTAMCSDPGVCAPGGGGYLTIDLVGHDPAVIDGYMAFPGIGFAGEAFTRSVSMEYGGGVTTNVDAGSVAVPGAFAAFSMASKRYGLLPWRDLMHIVADIIERGFPLSQTAHTYLLDAGDPIFGQDPISRAALFDEDVLRRQGEKVAFVDLAPTLRLLGDDGVETLYGGSLGEAIADDLRARGGRLTREDFSSYQAIARQPLTATMDDWRVLTNPPPAVGGVALMTAMAVLANSRHPLDPAVWMKSLTEAFTVRSKELELAEDREAAADQILKRAGLRSPSTIAVAAVDDSGSAVAASFSAGYGSGVVPHGTGMLMNNSVGEIELLPGGIESHTPGQRMLSNMAPSIARSNNKVIALASPGADRITSALTITLARAVLAGDGLVAAINHPRVHPEFTDSGVRAAVEPGLDISGLKGEIRFYDETHMYFGGVAGAALELSSLTAYADPRRVGSAVLIN